MVGWETTKRARLKPTLTARIFIPSRTITYSFYSENCDTNYNFKGSTASSGREVVSFTL